MHYAFFFSSSLVRSKPFSIVFANEKWFKIQQVYSTKPRLNDWKSKRNMFIVVPGEWAPKEEEEKTTEEKYLLNRERKKRANQKMEMAKTQWKRNKQT